jgi:hypothetical protein
MPLTITSASDINTLLNWILGNRDDDAVDDSVQFEAAREAAVRLADQANKTLSAGLRGDKVREAWDRVEAGPWYDDEPYEWDRGPDIEDVDTGGLT